MRKTFALLLCMILVASSIAIGGLAEEKTKITFWTITSDNMEPFLAGGFEARFEAAYPQYDLVVEIIPGTAADFETQYNAAKMSGMTPDVAYLTLTSFASLGTRGEFIALDDYINAWDSKDDILEASLNMGKTGESFSGIGCAPAPVLLMYRTDMFEAAGLDPDKPPTNWEELADYAEKLTIKDAQGNVTQAGLDIPSIDYFLNICEPFMLMNGATVVDEVNRTPMLTEPEVIETLEYLYNIYSKRVTLPHDWQKVETIPFMNGIGAMGFQGPDRYYKLLKDNPDLEGKVRMAPPISKIKPATFCGYRLLTVSVNSQIPDAAWDLIDFYMSPDEMAQRVDLDVIPVRKSLEASYVERYPDYGQFVVEAVSVGKGAFVVPWVATLYKYFGPAYESIMQGLKTPAEAMEEAQRGLLGEIS
jgi:multiple sugar transport system substrate-binding protein